MCVCMQMCVYTDSVYKHYLDVYRLCIHLDSVTFRRCQLFLFSIIFLDFKLNNFKL